VAPKKESCLFGEWPRLQSTGKIHITYLFDRMADVILQKTGDLPAKRHVIKDQTTNKMFRFVFDYQIALV